MKKNTKKPNNRIFLNFVAAVMLVTVLTSCGQGLEPSETTATVRQSQIETTTKAPATSAPSASTVETTAGTSATTQATTTPEPTTETTTIDIYELEIRTPPEANALAPLKINTYDGYNQPCHPKVLYFENGWNGYAYWMVYTPYPYCEDSLENPSIAVSDDGVEWITPTGLKNPVTGIPPTYENSAHYSDPHILMNGETMELWFRYNPSYADGVNADSNGGIILRTISQDGINWSKPETMLPGSQADRNPVLSPVVILEDGIYSMWYAKRDGFLHRITSSDGYSWSKAEKVNLEAQGYNIWHHDIVSTDLGYEAVFCARPKNATHNLKGLELFYAVSYDGMNYTEPVKIISPRKGTNAFDNSSIYRSSILKRDGYYLIYYSSMSENWIWKISLCAGPDISFLVGQGKEGFKTR